MAALGVSRRNRKGVILQLGVITASVDVHSSVKDDNPEIALRTVCLNEHPVKEIVSNSVAAPSLVSRSLVCPVCANEDPAKFGKARQVGDGLVVIDPKVLEDADKAEEELKEVLNLTPYQWAEVSEHTVPTGKRYYLGGGGDVYAMVRDLVASRPDLAFVSQWTLRTAATTFRLVADGDLLVLEQLAERALTYSRPQVTGTADPKLLTLASQFVDTMVEPFNPEVLDRPKARIIAAFVEGRVPVGVKGVSAGGDVADMLGALEAAVRKHRNPPAAPARKRAAKKSTAKPAARKAS